MEEFSFKGAYFVSMSKTELTTFIRNNLTFEVLPKTKEILWYINEDSKVDREEYDTFFSTIEKVDPWNLVLEAM